MTLDFEDQKQIALSLADTVRTDLPTMLTETALQKLEAFDLADDAAHAAAQALASAELALALGADFALAIMLDDDSGETALWNAEIGVQIAAYAAENGLEEADLQALVVDAVNSETLCLEDMAGETPPLWDGPSDTWQDLARPVGDTDPPGGTGIMPVTDDAIQVIDGMATDFFLFFETSLAESGAEIDNLESEALQLVAQDWAETVWDAADGSDLTESFWDALIIPAPPAVLEVLAG
ncbi:hypothetical protein CKO11_08630 [Rhodobacter sp. TJ_12]|uniref:hypothetical protein n=1 Tax=Rhodobacter sp. TJ_12 TaxID=2029399 RepID=UPI001CBCD69E|nr:hypothetical protein [Rhodobacter sp. TJ_12]MBZ4022522.1 hypothetical protein [Rhodobacter sp. TJ_12]